MGREEDSIRRSFWRYALVAAVICIVFLFIKRDNILRWVQVGHTVHTQQRYIESLKEDNDRLDSKIDDLTNNRDSLEKFARETYGFCVEGEDVYIDKK